MYIWSKSKNMQQKWFIKIEMQQKNKHANKQT